MVNKLFCCELSRFFCCECGKEGIPIIRKNCSKRESGHLKKLFCIFCGKETNHAEIKDCDNKYTVEDFNLEFSLGRFVNGLRVPISDLISCTKGDCKYNIDGKCWDAANINNCKYKVGDK